MRRMILLVILAILALGGMASAQETGAELRLVETLPGDGSVDIPTDGAITAIFNRPVVPLTAIEALGTLPNPLRIEPAVSGRGEWLNSAIYVFRPEPALAGGSTYTVSIDPALTTPDGVTLAESFAWSFNTVSPQIIEVVPAPGDVGVRLDASVQVAFNMPMERASTERAFALSSASGGVAGAFEWNEDDTGFRFTPSQPFALDTVYDYRLNSEARGQGGGSGLQEQVGSFVSVPAPGVVRTDPFDGQPDAQLYGLTLFFASPMNPETLADKITIEPQPWRETDTYYSDYDYSYTLSFPVEPSTDYTITIAAGAEDVYGNRLEQPITLRYRTIAYDPDVSLQAPFAVGFYNASNPQTQVYLTHRNVSLIDLELYRVALADFLPLLAGPTSYDPTMNYVPNGGDLLRRWQIPSVAPENARRYELLDLGASGNGVACAGSPASRLRVGDSARVISDPDPVRARATPGDGEIVTLLYRDYALTLTGGPECVNDVLWWQVALRDGESAWIAEGVGEEYFIAPTAAAAQTPVALTATDGGALPAGIYFLSAASPETAAIGFSPVKHFLIVGSANLTLKTSIDAALVWVTDVNTGLPIANAPVSLYDNNYLLLAQGTTNADGLLVVDLPRGQDLYAPRLAVLNDGEHFGIGTSGWAQGIEGYDFALGVDYAPEAYRAYVYTDRPIYRPGQPVYFRGVVRARDDVNYTPSDLSEVPIRIFGGDDGALLYEATLPLTPFGTFSGQFELAGDAPLGFYRVVTELPRPNPAEPYYGSEGTVSFQVAQYRTPEFQVSVTAENSEVIQGETIRAVVESRYFFGGLVANATVEYNVIANPYFFNTPSAPYFSFVDFDYDAGASELYGFSGGVVASGTGTTDADGRLLIEIPADLRDSTQSLIYTLEATVTDESGQAVAARSEIVVHKGAFYIGVQPQEYVVTASAETGVDLRVFDTTGEPVADQEIEIEIVERRWSSVQEEDAAGRAVWTWEVEEIPLTSGSARSDASGRAEYRFTPPSGGIYKLYARSRDEAGNLIIASTQLWVSSGNYITWRQQNSNRIDLIADRDEYAVGDTAEILIASPFQGSAEALITVERGDVLLSERITLDSNSTVYRLPITAEYSPNIFVSVFIVKGVDENNPVAAFRMGMIQLGVDNAQRELTLTLTPDRENAGPGDVVEYTVLTTDYAGNPVQAEVGVGLTDLASLSVADPNSVPILNYFYGQQLLGVRTSSALTINADQLTQEVLDTIKGGGGGFGEGGIFDIRQEFVDTAYWNAALVTDSNGMARFSVTLPDNLTTWRLDARAVTLGTAGDLLVGDATTDLISSKPLLIRPVTPRFFVAGDEVSLAAIVNNNSAAPLTVEVALEATGITLLRDAVQSVTVAGGQQQHVEWRARIGDDEAVGLTFFARSGDLSDASRPPLGQGEARTLPVYRYTATETAATAGALSPSEQVTETISLPGDLNVQAATLRVDVQPSLILAALNTLAVQELPPNPSVEEMVSSFLPNLTINRILMQTGINEPNLQQQLQVNIGRALQSLYASQRVDGGWGWYTRDDSNPAVTAYALIGLINARTDGYDIDEGVIRRAQDFLRGVLIASGLDVEPWRLNRQAHILYALALSGQPDAARMANLYEVRGRLSLDAQAVLAMALHSADATDARAAALVDGLVSGAISSATGTHWQEAQRDPFNWSSDTRTTAITLHTLMDVRPDSALVPNIVRWLMTARRADGWETQQETSWVLMALARYIAVTGDYGFTAQDASTTTQIVVNDEPLALTATGEALSAQQPLPTDVPGAVIITNNGLNTLYYTAQIDLTLPMDNVAALNRGIVVERRYTIAVEGEMRTVSSARVGDTITVRLTLIAPNDLHFVLLEDPIPSGTDAINPELATSPQIGTQPELTPQDPLSQGWGWWWFANIEFRDAHVVLSATYLPAGSYEFVYTLRAGLPGVYNVLPAHAREVYFPEVFGRSDGLIFTIESG
jgi:hypothetical protein